MGVNEKVEPTPVVAPSLLEYHVLKDDMQLEDDMPQSMVLTPRDIVEHNDLDLHTKLVRGRDHPLMLPSLTASQQLLFACHYSPLLSTSEDPLTSSDTTLRRQPDYMFHAEPKAEMNVSAVEELGHQLDGLAIDGINNAYNAGLGMEDEEMVDEKMADGSDDDAVQLDFDESEPSHDFVHSHVASVYAKLNWTRRSLWHGGKKSGV